MKEAAAELERRGFSPYILLEPPRCDDLGALSYVEALLEIRQQLKASKMEADYIYCSAAGPTQAGLMVGSKALNLPVKVCGITPLRGDHDLKIDIADNANRLFKLLGIQLQLSPRDVLNWDDYVGEMYGKPSPEGLEAMRVVARTEGVLLDPVYTGKAMAGLFDHIRKGMIAANSTVVFLHTGGTPALFAYASELDLD
jgi:1-aminocyclopropane-1-carboxylate deaminase/D-cysteine desulfhydrase-like pyridoxal-dependent ACC family enzyme